MSVRNEADIIETTLRHYLGEGVDKIVQRLSVRIHVPASVAERGELRPGMSVVVSINTKPHAVAPLARVSLN